MKFTLYVPNEGWISDDSWSWMIQISDLKSGWTEISNFHVMTWTVKQICSRITIFDEFEKKFENKNSKCSNQIFPKPSKYFDFINYFKLNNFFFISKYKFILIHFNLKCPWRWISQTSVKIYFWTNQIRVFLGQTARCKQFAWS